ncbi:MSCRAMM family protein [Halorubrum aethiopicum]|uniref:MSCRAMM family protein n=1 Tax=Halorubrum aethiopicum TaxID=1758255 RepID=UPI00082EB533|nr:carboxypeptidase-like regulatory domain-containing protein [Halorubrum aethiopicum]
MPSLRVYDTKGNEHSPTGGGGRSNERVKDLFYDGVRLAIEAGRERKFTMFFRARETRNARTEQFYAVYTTRDGSMREFIDALRDRIETEWGYTIDDSADDMSVFRALDAGNTSLPGSDQDRAILEELVGSRQGGTVGVRDAESALGLVNELMGTYNRAAVADSPESNALSDFDLVVAPDGSSGIAPIGDTEERWESTKESIRSRLIDEEIASINESVQTLSREHGLSSSEIRRRVSQRVPALSASSSGGSTADRLSTSGSSSRFDMAEIGKYVAIAAVVLIVLIGGFFGASALGLLPGSGPGDAQVDGTVYGTDDEPLTTGTEVTLEPTAAPTGNETAPEPETVTTEGGEFAFQNVSAGNYTLSIASTERFAYDNQTVEVPGNTSSLNISPAGGIVSGQVVDAETGDPISTDNGSEIDASVELVDGAGETVASATGGNYEFTVDLDGSYTLRASADGYESAERSVGSFGEQEPIELESTGGAQEEEESTGVALEGEITSNGTAIEGATVEVTVAPGETYNATTSQFGMYEITGIPSGGEYRVEVRADGYETDSRQVGFSGENQVVEENFELEPTQS